MVRPEAAAEELRRLNGSEICAALGDITTESGREAALKACSAPDIVINNAGGPLAGDFRNFTDAQWQATLQANLLTRLR